MIKKFLIIVFFTLFLMGNDLQPLYKDGLKAFNDKEFEKAYKIFDNLFKVDSANPQFNYYLGRSAFEVGLYEKALSAYERVLIIDESHIRSKLERGRTYVALGMYDEAKLDLEEVLAKNPPNEVKANIKVLLNLMAKKEKRSFINYFLSVGFGYDTNVNATPGEEALVNYFENTYQDLPKENIDVDDKVKDKFIQESLNIHHIYDFGEKESFFIDNNLLIYNQNYLDSSDYNVLFGRFATGIGYVKGDKKILLPILFDKIIYGGDNFLDVVSFNPNISKIISKGFFFNSYLNFQRKFYSKSEDDARDTNVKEIGVDFVKIFDTHTFNLKCAFSNEDRVNSKNVDFVDRDIQTFKLSYSKNILNLMNLNLEYLLRKSKYETLLKSGNKREDNYKSYLFKLSKDIDKSKFLTFSYNYIDNSSNYEPMVYDKSVYLVNFNINF